MKEILRVNYRQCPRIARRAAILARNMMCEDISRHLVLKDLARSAGTNECTLKRGFRYQFNTSIYQYLLGERMKRARRLLLNTAIQEKYIAYSCGFESLAGFINSFRRLYGISPGAFRKKKENKRKYHQKI